MEGPRGARQGAWIALAASLVSAALSLWATAPRGPGIDNDSAQYLAAAESVREGAGFVGVDGAPFTLWPPLYPTLIAVAEALAPSRNVAVRALHAIALAVAVAAAVTFVARVRPSRVATVACALLAVTSPVLFTVSALTWSEVVYVALLACALHAWLSWSRTRSRRAFAALCALSAAVVLQRYLGVTWIASCAALLWLDARGERWTARLRRCATFAGIALAPVVLWFARNAWIARDADGRRGPARATLAHDAERTWDVLADLFGGFTAPWAAAGALLLVAWSLVRAREREPRAPLVLAAVHTLALLALRQAIEFDQPDERLLVPLAWIAPVVVSLALAATLASPASTARTLAIAGLVVASLVMLAGNVRQLSARVETARTIGAGFYERDAWLESPTSLWVAANHADRTWLTNDASAIYFASGLRARELPYRPAGFAKLHTRVPSDVGELSIAWYRINERSVFPVDALSERFDVTRVAELADGEIYELRRK